MRLVKKDNDNIVVEFTASEYQDIINVVKAAVQHFDEIDPYIIEMSFEHALSIKKKLREVRSGETQADSQ